MILYPPFIFSGKKVGFEILFFSVQDSDSGGTFCLHFWNLHKIWIQESIDLKTPLDSVDVAS